MDILIFIKKYGYMMIYENGCSMLLMISNDLWIVMALNGCEWFFYHGEFTFLKVAMLHPPGRIQQSHRL
jgi:hypothetical protein